MEVLAKASLPEIIPLFNGIGYEILSSMMKFFVCVPRSLGHASYSINPFSLALLVPAIQKKLGMHCKRSTKTHRIVVDECPVLSCPADATQCSEAWDALEMDVSRKPLEESPVEEAVEAKGRGHIDIDNKREVLNLKAQVHAQPQAGNPNGGSGAQSLTTLLVGNLMRMSQICSCWASSSTSGKWSSYSVCREHDYQCSLGYGYVAMATLKMLIER
nr:uncharacterized protein LOC109160086 isoform X4 [Ipomoea batatas]